MTKKIVIFMLVMITPFMVLAYKPGDTYIKGDADNSGKVTSTDYIVLRKHILKQTTLTGDAFIRADVTGDNKITSLDYIAIRKMILNGQTNEKITVPGVTPKPTVKPVLTKEEQICESVKNNSSIDYKSFMSLKKDNDDYYAIKAAHDCANKYNKPIKITKGTYNIYNKTTGNITVKTNTDFNNSTIYIHDEKGIVGTDYNNHIFKISSNGFKTVNKTRINGIKIGNTIKELSGSSNGYYVRVIDLNDNKRVFIRFGSNANSGETRSDAFRVDTSGKILDPIFWNYDNCDIKLIYNEIPKEKLVFKNATMYTIVDTNTSRNTKSSKGSIYMRRGILVNRSNVLVDNIKHAIINSSKKTISEVNHGYFGFYDFENAANVTFSNSRVYAVKNNNAHVNSTYDLVITNITNGLFKNIVMYDYTGNIDYFNKESNQARDNLWGVNGSNKAKNITFDGCILNRIDAHTGFYNLTVKNTRLGRHGFTLIGFGELNIENVVVYYQNTFIKLRKDYGSFWNGFINIKNCWMHPGNNDPVSLVEFQLSYDDNGYLHNFGYDLVLPKINVNGFKVFNNSSTLYAFDNSITGKANGDLRKLKSYIKNNQFSYSYPNKNDIKGNNINNRNGSINFKNYVKDFGQN